MIQSAAELAALVEGSFLGGREVFEIGVPESDAVVLGVRIDPEEVLEAWRVGRSVLTATGRWPVAVCDWGSLSPTPSGPAGLADVLDRIEYQWERGGPISAGAVVEAARTVDVETYLAAKERSDPEAYAFGPADAPAPEDEAKGEPDDWFVPTGQSTAVFFLPCAESADTLAYVHWYAGMSEMPSEVLVALARRWSARFGAELVAHWGTMLQFVVDRPPATIDDARVVAREHVIVAPCTVWLPGVEPEHYAHGLVGADRWFLHERP